ncbi:stem cell self-renewal protein Piwi, partial [Lophiostoma macrostomum CBS 122681]
DCTLVLLDEKDFDKYSTVKRIADLEYGQHSLCAEAGKIFKSGGKRLQHLSNLALKVNMKVGGDNHQLDPKQLESLLEVPTMILGADVTHPGVGSKWGCPSIACVVGSVDQQFMNYPGSMRLQAGKQEYIEDMRSMVRERLEAWGKNSTTDKKLPTSIIFYRDGVSESQFENCAEREITQIKEAYEELDGDPTELELTFIVVGKRHHTRFYPTEESQSYWVKEVKRNSKGKVISDDWIVDGNLKPGLLVENVVTSPKPYNFFLQSHCAIKGTARSAHYHVLRDGTGKAKEILPKLTLMLCCAFGRATKAVSYAAPAYIADRLCERGRVYL